MNKKNQIITIFLIVIFTLTVYSVFHKIPEQKIIGNPQYPLAITIETGFPEDVLQQGIYNHSGLIGSEVLKNDTLELGISLKPFLNLKSLILNESVPLPQTLFSDLELNRIYEQIDQIQLANERLELGLEWGQP